MPRLLLALVPFQLVLAERGRRLAAGYGPRGRVGERTPRPFFRVDGIAAAPGFASSVEEIGPDGRAASLRINYNTLRRVR